MRIMKYPAKILIVDDETDFLSVSASILRDKGFEVYALSGGEELLHAVRSFKPHLILLDVKLGNLDGRLLCRQLKEDPETSSIRVILQSAFTEVGKEYNLFGAEEFMLKPYTIDHLISRIIYRLK